MNITIAVMAHPKRKAAADALLDQLRKYPFKEATIIWDEIDNEWHTGARALRWGIDRGDFHVVIQDDARLTTEFYANIEGAIHNCPGGKALISLYTGTARPFGKRVKNAVERAEHATWLRHFLLMWGVGFIIPTSHIQPMLEFVVDRQEPYDTRIGIFYHRNRLPIYYTMPCLVDHDDGVGSLLGHGATPEPRVAHKLATGLIAWNNQVIDI